MVQHDEDEKDQPSGGGRQQDPAPGKVMPHATPSPSTSEDPPPESGKEMPHTPPSA